MGAVEHVERRGDTDGHEKHDLEGNEGGLCCSLRPNGMHGLFQFIDCRLQPLQFKIGITCHAMLPNTSLRMFACRAAPVTADEFPDDDASDPETAWPRLQEDDPALHALWGESVSVQISERHSDSTGQFDWPSMPLPHVVQSQIKFGEAGVCAQAGLPVCDVVPRDRASRSGWHRLAEKSDQKPRVHAEA